MYSGHVSDDKIFILCACNLLYNFSLGEGCVWMIKIMNYSCRVRPTTINNKTKFLCTICMFDVRLRCPQGVTVSVQHVLNMDM